MLRAAFRRSGSRTASLLRHTRSISLKADGYPQDFTFYPAFFSLPEQRLLLSTALEKLNMSEPRKVRRRQRELLASRPPREPNDQTLDDIFLPDEYYTFEEGHFDGVIKRFREMHVSSWPQDNPELSHVLERLHSVHPEQPTQTHLLHLASDGEILPHVDNLEASGSWILGVSLGDARILRLESSEDPDDSYELLLPSGSLYIQQDTTRYEYKHAIRKDGRFGSVQTGGRQRLSIMIRDLQSD